MSDAKTYWEGKLRKYGDKEWVDKPTIFVDQVVQYFPSGGKVLELAAGLGRDSRHLASLGFQVLCTDLSDFGLQEAKRKTEGKNLSIAFEKVDISKPLPFENNEFNVVYSHLGLHYLDKQATRALFEEIKRVLKPNGVFAALFNSVDDPEIQGDDFEKIEDDYYHEIPTDLSKRYFSVKSIRELIDGLFETIVIDQEGSAYKDGKKKLIRLVAKATKWQP